MKEEETRVLRLELEKICTAPLNEHLQLLYRQCMPAQEKDALTLAFTHANMIIMLFRCSPPYAESFYGILRRFCESNNIDESTIERITVDVFTYLTDLVVEKFKGDWPAPTR